MYLYILDGHLTRSVPNRFSHYANPGSASHTLASFSVVPCPACISVHEQTVSIPPPPIFHSIFLSYRPSLSYSSLSTSTRHPCFHPCVFLPTSLPLPSSFLSMLSPRRPRGLVHFQIGHLQSPSPPFTTPFFDHDVFRTTVTNRLVADHPRSLCRDEEKGEIRRGSRRAALRDPRSIIGFY